MIGPSHLENGKDVEARTSYDEKNCITQTDAELDSNEYQETPQGMAEWLFILVLCSSQLFTQAALGSILVPLHIVSSTFGQGEDQAGKMSWHIAAYSLTVGTFILFAGKMGDIYGSKHILIVAWIWSGIWSIIAGCSAFTGSAIFFDICRAFQGIGPAFLLPNSLAVVGRTYPPGVMKNVVFSLFALCAPVGCCLGALIASAFAVGVWWPWSMWFSAMVCFVIAAISFFVVPHDSPKYETETRTKFDWLGSVLGVIGLLLINISWNQAPIDGWSTPYVYVLLIVGFAFMGLFVLQDRRVEHPLLDLSIFNRHVAFVLVVTGLGWSCFGIWIYYMFQFLQKFRGVSALNSVAQFVPATISGIMASFATPYLMATVPTGWVMAIALFAFLAGAVLEATAPVDQSYWFNTFWSFAIMSCG
jgi:MFS family permease